MASALNARREHRDEHGAQARVLAELLRGSRITLLLGAGPAPDGTHWAAGLMRQLRRRAGDRGCEAPTVFPFAERRELRVGPIARCDAEVVVFFDAWGAGAPLDALRARLDDALVIAGWGGASTHGPLVDTLAGLNQQLGARFLFVFDRFEQLLEADADRPDVRAFTEQWVRLLEDLTVAANFLVGLSEDAEHLLAGLRERVPRIDRHWVRLPSTKNEPARADLPSASNDSTLGDADDRAATECPDGTPAEADAASASEPEWQSWIEAMQLRTARLGRGEPAGRAPRSPPSVTQTSDVYAAVEEMLTRTAELNRQPPWGGGAARADEAHADAGGAAAPATATPRLPHRHVAWGAVALLGLAIGLFVARTEPSATAPPGIEAGAERAAAVPSPRVALRIDADAHAGIAADLADRLAPTSSSDAPRLELVRYDQLRRLQGTNLAEPPRIVAPLFTEELHFLVRADSPLSAIHQIRASRINVGPAASPRAGTASSAYAALFGRGLPEAQADRRPLDEATAALLDGRVDVLVLVAGQPAQGLSALPPAVARMLRPLRLERRDLSSQRALQTFLAGTLRPESYPGWIAPGGVPTLAVMTFLVAPEPVDSAVDRRQAVVEALCADLPSLRARGHPKWREVEPGLRLDTGWPDAGPLAAAWRACAARTP